MKLHPILTKKYLVWWFILLVVTVIHFYLHGLPDWEGYQEYGIMFWSLGYLFSALLFGSILYLLIRIIRGKWNNKIFMICISIMLGIMIILSWI